MERPKSKGKRLLIIISIILLVAVLIVSIVANIQINNLLAKEKQANISYTDTKNINSEELDDLLSQLTNINQEIDNLNNIDNTIEEAKKDLFKNAKQLEDDILVKKANKKIAYLTFDDGPYYLTYSVLNTLKKYKVKATFFTIGRGKEYCYDNYNANCTLLYNEIVKGGHTIANHTYSHLIWGGLYYSSTSFMNEVIKQENLIKEKTGVTTNIVRFPGGSSTAGGLKNDIVNKLRQRGYGWVDWTAQDGDGGDLPNATIAWSNFTNSINSNIEVVLMHDYSNITYSILPDIINYLQNKGYILLPLFYESNMINK